MPETANAPGTVSLPDVIRWPGFYPPEIVAWSNAEGRYQVATRICMARWASSNAVHDAGEICGREATDWLGDVEVCPHHLQRAVDGYLRSRVAASRKTRAEIAASAVETMQRTAEAERLMAERMSIVYYALRTSDDMIKIGTTANWKARRATLVRDHGELILLLAHAGSKEKEREMHLKFARLRPGVSEWFEPGAPLLKWISSQRAAARRKTTELPDQLPYEQLRIILKELAVQNAHQIPRAAQSAASDALRPVRERLASLEVLTPAEAARFLDLTTDDLAAMREDGTGPEYIVLTGTRFVRYLPVPLRSWKQARLVAQITSKLA